MWALKTCLFLHLVSTDGGCRLSPKGSACTWEAGVCKRPHDQATAGRPAGGLCVHPATHCSLKQRIRLMPHSLRLLSAWPLLSRFLSIPRSFLWLLVEKRFKDGLQSPPKDWLSCLGSYWVWTQCLRFLQQGAIDSALSFPWRKNDTQKGREKRDFIAFQWMKTGLSTLKHFGFVRDEVYQLQKRRENVFQIFLGLLVSSSRTILTVC